MSRSIGENFKKLFFFLNYLPLQIWTLKICNHYISKTLTARSFKLGQLIEDEVDQLVKIKKKSFCFFSNNLPLQIWTFKCSLNSLTLKFCRYDRMTSLHSPLQFLIWPPFIYKHLLGA